MIIENSILLVEGTHVHKNTTVKIKSHQRAFQEKQDSQHVTLKTKLYP